MSEYGMTKTGRVRKKPNLVHVNVRLPLWVYEYYKEQPNYTRVIRDVLVMHAQENQPKLEEEQ